MFSGLINPNVAIFNTILSQILNFSGFSTFPVFAAFKKKIKERLDNICFCVFRHDGLLQHDSHPNQTAGDGRTGQNFACQSQ